MLEFDAGWRFEARKKEREREREGERKREREMVKWEQMRGGIERMRRSKGGRARANESMRGGGGAQGGVKIGRSEKFW